ncbi:hypothetical protein HDE_13406 [Halotydeus destructor]|nr:hypothetical protein HDE_13406 [Halotydeus destructor]
MTSNRITETIEELRLDSLRNQLTEGTDRMGKAINNDVPEDNDSNDKFTMVNTHRVLQKPPTLGEVLTAIRRALRIPTVKLVRDHDQI